MAREYRSQCDIYKSNNFLPGVKICGLIKKSAPSGAITVVATEPGKV